MTTDDKPSRKGVWTPDLLAEGPEKRRVFIEQRRQYLAPLLAEMKALAGELDADIAERPALYGDLPWSRYLRARKTMKPFTEAVADLESFIEHLTQYAARYKANYEELPEQRAEKQAHKERVAELKAGKAQPQIEAPPAREAESAVDPSPFFSHLKKTG
ncbi:hypothetical protein ACWDY7_32255 [Streptomyces calvus]|uniref:Uncharacterized protein n=1 Tax=Streptomyces calvus TaxID=67282 RepID=A0AA40SKW9_9ACTN|nr:hypothetical protein [Streptomyces calvus]MBA8948188.1 hypothetical protein [Streptomyces calvus]GGP84019.1 hypothetical protein GCM10010247_66730 [Streptomyces calvus]